MTSKVFLLLISCLFYFCTPQAAPAFLLNSGILGAITKYQMSYYLNNPTSTLTTFTVSFAESLLKVPNGTNSCRMWTNTSNISSPICSCNAKICTFKPNTTIQSGLSLNIEIANITNPFYLSTQIIPVTVYFTSSTNYNFNVSIPGTNYQPMQIIINNLTQSEFGVGSTPVTYTINVSMPYIAENMQLSVSIPKEITYEAVSSSLSFYETIQNSSPIQVQSILLYQLVVSNNSNPTGFMLLTLSGLCNPKFIGKSESFKLTFTTSSCSTCKIAELTSGLEITSKDAGDVIISQLVSTQNYISMETTLTLTLQLFAAIPTNGKISIHLPTSMSPVFPLFCSTVFGFITVTTPICKYNATANRIDTENFVTSSFDRFGTVMLAIKVINPQDSRKVNFVVSTYDSLNRMIGETRSSYSYHAEPLPLNATITKSQQQVETNFNLEAEITLGKQLNVSNNFMEILLPPVNYNLSGIKCYSAGLDLNCNKTTLSSKELSITFLPPCTVCSTGNKLQFKIEGLKNPSYISASNEIVTVNTRNSDGIIESSKSTISIIPSNITLTSYTKPQNKPVGSSYNLQLSLNLPDYVKINGGKIQIQFTPMSTYTNGQIIQNTYTEPTSSLSITLSNTSTTLNNNLQYDYDRDPYSIVKIIFDICDGTRSVCTMNSTIFNFTINGLKIGYIPSQTTTDILQVTTSMGEIISEKTIDTSQYSPTLLSSTLSVAASVSMTNTYSDLQFNFTSNQVAIDKTINLTIPIGLQINGQCSINALEGLIESFTCKKLSDTMVQIDYSLDQNLMIAKSITYMIVLTNVSTPVSVAPLTYSLFTTYQGFNNQKFTSSYAMQSPLPLNHTFSKNNDTINQDFRLSISIVPVTTIYDSYQFQISKSTVLLQQDWVPLFQLNETQTHYILTSQEKMTGNYVEIKARNSLTTSQSPEIYINLMYKGYLVQRSKIEISKNVPVVLGCSVTVSNRTVSLYADLTVVCDRNNMGELLEEKMIVMLPVDGFNYEGATFNGSALNSSSPKITIPISITSPRIITMIISKVKNLLFIPSPSLPSLSFLQITTTRSNESEILGISSLSSSTFSANSPFTIKNLVSSRNNLKSGEYTNISIDYLSELGDNGHFMTIELPSGQNTFISGESNCFIGTGLELCNIIRSNSTSITISLRPNSTILLTQLLNFYPNANTLQVSIYTSQQQLVSQGATSVLPAIALEKINLTGTSTTSESSSTNTIVLEIKPTQLKIDKDNIVVVTPPAKMFTRAFNTEDCRVNLVGTSGNFTGCNFTLDMNGWLENIRLGSFGPTDIEINSTLRITFSVTNGWTSYPFSGKGFTVTVFKNNSGALSEGTLPLITLFPNSTFFKPVTINKNMSFYNQSQLQASSPTTISMSIKLNGNVGKGTKIWIMLPKDTYSFISSENVTLEKEDISYYYVSKSINCALLGCLMYSEFLTLSVTNNFYVKKERNNLIAYGIYDGLPCTDQFILSPPINTPMLLPQLSINRNSSIGAALSTITIDFSLSSTPASNTNTNFNDISVVLSKNISNGNYPNTQYLYSIKESNSLTFTSVTPSISNSSTTLTFLLLASPLNTNQMHRLTIIGQNNIEVPLLDETYNILVQNSTHFLYEVPEFKFETRLEPIGSGLILFRDNSTVGMTNNLTLKGTLQTTESLQLSLYSLKINEIEFGPLTNPIVSLPLFSYINPSSSINESSFNVEICNISHCIYKQSEAKILPKLASIELTSNEVNFSIAEIMDISSTYKLKVGLTIPLIGKKFISIVADDRLYASIVTCVGSFSNSGKTESVELQYSSIKSTDTNGMGFSEIMMKSSSSTISVSDIEITFKTNPYQTILPNSPIKLISELPTVEFTKYYNFQILGKTINASLNPTSIQAKSISNYTITMQPLIREGVLSLIIPQYISKLFIPTNSTSSNDHTILQHLSVKNNGNNLALTGINSQLAGTLNSLYLLAYDSQTETFLLNFVINASILSPPVYEIFITNVTNPPDNRHLIFNIYQHELEISPSRIYASRQFDIKIEVQDRVHVYSGIRNVTKIGAPIELVLDIETLNTSPDELLIKLSTTQVIITESPCLICIGSICNIISTPSTANSLIISRHVPGRHNYLISGCIINSMFSQEPTETDLIYVGVSMPYQTAETNSKTSTYITPLISTGDIQISGIKSSNNNRAQYTTLNFTAQPENWQNCDGMLIEFEKLAYIVHNNLLVKVNGKVVGMNVISSSELYLEIGSNRVQVMNVEIVNIINYIENAGFTIRTLKKKTSIDSTSSAKLGSSLKSSIVSYTPSLYGVMDLITLQTAPISFVPSSSHARIIFPDNYLSGGAKKIIVINDDDLPIEMPSSSLSYSFGSSEIGCKFDNLPYNKTITITCTTLVAGTANFALHLFDSKLSSMPLTSFTKSIYIYPAPKGSCDNVMCDLCSEGESGSEYCFECREGLYSLNGECVHECPTQNFPYNDQTCVNCSPDCEECYDIFDNSCLSCNDETLLLDSGTCTTSCSSGYAYQSKYCVNSDECSTESGCRLCSSTGFCYECLPDYDGEPTCTYYEVLPKNFFIFFMLPIIIALPLISLIGCIKVGAHTFSHLLIFLLSFVEITSWIFVIPKMPEQALAMIMCSFLLIKIIVSIVSYETYYNKLITRKRQNKLLGQNERESEEKTDNISSDEKKVKAEAKEEEIEMISHKERLVRFTAHFLGCDAYELLMYKWAKPYFQISHFTPFLVVNLLNRAIVLFFLIYVLVSKSSSGDLVWVPIIAVISGVAITLTRILNSSKVSTCIAKIRG